MQGLGVLDVGGWRLRVERWGLRSRGLGCWVVALIPKKPGLQPNLNLGLHLPLRPGTLVWGFGLRKGCQGSLLASRILNNCFLGELLGLRFRYDYSDLDGTHSWRSMLGTTQDLFL